MTPSELRTLRQARGETQTELAEKLGVDIKTIQRWEKGTSPVPLAIEKLLMIWKRQAARKEKRKARVINPTTWP